MHTKDSGLKPVILAITMAMALPLPASADENYALLKAQVEALQQQLQQVQETLKQYGNESASNKEVSELRREIAQAAEWKEPNTLIHMSGYADVGYTDVENSDGTFNLGSFAPIFHYQYRDLVMLESELELAVDDTGITETVLEYLTIDLLLGDYLTLVGGKFLSPIGQFRQNQHPSWINKMASAPPGFGHDGAAPVSEIGFQARGGFPMGDMFANYAVYVGNGPELLSVFEDGEFELEGIEAEGFGTDNDGEKVFGGRFAFLPTPRLELGFSAVGGKATVTGIEEEEGEEGPDLVPDLSAEPARDYNVYGFDFAWKLNNINLRGEYVRTKIGADTVGLTASPGSTWETWYTQASYLLPQSKWETAIRYTDFNSPHASEDQQQWAVGLNYLFASSVLGKLSYEFNDGQPGSRADSNRWLFQLAYGF